jgi:hypothetical protein
VIGNIVFIVKTTPASLQNEFGIIDPLRQIPDRLTDATVITRVLHFRHHGRTVNKRRVKPRSHGRLPTTSRSIGVNTFSGGGTSERPENNLNRTLSALFRNEDPSARQGI